MSTSKMIAIAALALGLPGTCAAAAAEGEYFTHNDWEIACDNTRTCRAAGYQPYEDENAVSVLLTRRAGADEAVAGQLMLGGYEDSDSPTSVSLHIDERDLGRIAIATEDASGTLSAAQVQALLAVLPRSATIVARSSDDSRTWTLSDHGAAAVLLKMDELQGRIGTTGALVRDGERNEDAVLPPVAPPRVQRVTPPPTPPADADIANDPTLLPALDAAVASEDICNPDFARDEGVTLYRLDATTLLVEMPCWRGAYNASAAFLLIAPQAPFSPRLITTAGTEYVDGQIGASHKGRGLGDCWSSSSWIWDGRSFVHVAESTTGLCRLVAAGGAWDLPTLVSEIVD